MNFTTDLESLIAEIDDILPKSGYRPQQVNIEQVQQVLQKVHSYLMAVQMSQLDLELTYTDKEVARQIAQAVIAQIDNRLTDWLTPLETELEALRQQRQSLRREIQQLERQRQQMMSEFLDRLIVRCQQTWQQQMAQIYETFENQLSSIQLSDYPKRNPSSASLIEFQQQSDQLLMSLDATFRTVFETLEQDLQGYYDSLSQGLERMHSLGQQGEAKFIAYLNRLSQQLENVGTVEGEGSVGGEGREPNVGAQSLRPQSVEREGRVEIKNSEEYPQTRWYLGIDCNPLGLSAVLLKAGLGLPLEQYPIHWLSNDEQFSNRLPVTFPEYSKGESTLTLNWMQQALEALFATLTTTNIKSAPEFTTEALGLSEESFRESLTHLDGIGLNCPVFWGETEHYQLRETVLKTQLIKDSQQIFLAESAVASLLAHLPMDIQSDSCPSGMTILVIYGGKMTTELVLVNLYDNFSSLTHQNLSLYSFLYGSQSLDQDILCQLIYPQWISQLHPSLPPLDIEIPKPGEPDQEKRNQLRLSLENHPIGHSLLEAAKLVKLILQEQEELTSQLANQAWSVKREDLEEQVIYPLIQELNQSLNQLLSQTETEATAIAQVICSGEIILSLERSLSTWLEEKFPDATVILSQDEETKNDVAFGLARLPLFRLARV